ncbi:lactate dehydrogenase [Acidobacteriota bacterium]
MDIAIIGAGGSVGWAIAQMIVSQRLLECGQRLILVGNPDGSSVKTLYGFASDLMDAYAEVYPKIEVLFEPEKIKADLIVMAGGAIIEPGTNSEEITRDFLAGKNFPVFERYVSILARHGHGNEIVICISNPNELAVAVFAKYLDRQRVIGMGAFLDTWRFRGEIALDLNIRRQRIHGFMVGEHGANVVFLWSSVHIYGYKGEKLRETLKKIRRGYRTANFSRDVGQALGEVKTMIAKGEIRQAYDFVASYPPDIRSSLKPYITHFCGSKMVMGTAKVTLELIRIITLGSDALISGQIALQGEFHGIHSTIGVPFVVGNQGVDNI